MTLNNRIKNNPYLKISNCVDINDVNYALSELKNLEAEFGSDCKKLNCLLLKFLLKKYKLEA